jgi:hypothetical protein
VIIGRLIPTQGTSPEEQPEAIAAIIGAKILMGEILETSSESGLVPSLDEPTSE